MDLFLKAINDEEIISCNSIDELSMDLNEISFCLGMGRPSNCQNEDDFDYALELRFVNNHSINRMLSSNKMMENMTKQNAEENNNDDLKCEVPDIEIGNIKSAPPKIKSHIDENIVIDDDINLISPKSFIKEMNVLQNRRAWIESVARRSSASFHRLHQLTDEAIFERFQFALANGVNVRRHRSGRSATIIHLISTDACKNIDWHELNSKKKKQSGWLRGAKAMTSTLRELIPSYQGNKNENRIYQKRFSNNNNNDNNNNNEESGKENWYYTVEGVASGCLTEQHTIHNNHQSDRTSNYNNNNNNNNKYPQKYTMSSHNIIAVHPADREDPSCPNRLGTEDFRNSSDVCCQALSFTVVYRQQQQSQSMQHSEDEDNNNPTTSRLSRQVEALQYLNIECFDGRELGAGQLIDAEELYFTLFGGFLLLLHRSEARRTKERVYGTGTGTISAPSTIMNTRKSTSKVSEIVPVKSISKQHSTTLFGRVFHQLDPTSALWVNNNNNSHSSSGQNSNINMVDMNGGEGSTSVAIKENPNSHLSISYLPDMELFRGWRSAGIQIVARLQSAGLETKCLASYDFSRVLIKIRCPEWRQKEVAEILGLKIRQRSGALKKFKVSQLNTYVNSGVDDALFHSADRQRIIDYILRSSRKDGGAELDKDSGLDRYIYQKFPLHMEARLLVLRHVWVTFWKNESVGFIAEPWSPITTELSVTIGRFACATSRFFRELLNQPLDGIAEYFGEGIAFYFAWLSFHTNWLVVPAILGIIVFICQVQSETLDHPLCIPYAIFIMIWYSIMIAKWRQRSSLLAYRWGVLGFEENDETQRPEFRGTLEYRKQKETQEQLAKEPNRDLEDIEDSSLYVRAIRYTFTVPAIILCMGAVLTIAFYLISTEYKLMEQYLSGQPVLPYSTTRKSQYINNSNNNSNQTTTATTATPSHELSVSQIKLSDPNFWVLFFLYPCLYAIILDIMSVIFHKIARYLSVFENHSTDTAYWNSLVVKVFSFRFVTVFTSLYFYAIFFDDTETSYLRISSTIFGLMTVGHWCDKFLDIGLPAMIQRLLLIQMRIAISEVNRQLFRDRCSSSLTPEQTEALNQRAIYLEQARSECWEEALQMSYETVGDFSALVTQLGYVLLFSGVFPLASLIALINNIILIRLNALKLTYYRQRPVSRKTSGLGVWEDIIQIMSVLGVLTSCFLMGFTSGQLQTHWKSIGPGGIAVVLFLIEHLVLIFKYWLHHTIPRIPSALLRYLKNDSSSKKYSKQYRKEKRLQERLDAAAALLINNNERKDNDDQGNESSVDCRRISTSHGNEEVAIAADPQAHPSFAPQQKEVTSNKRWLPIISPRRQHTLKNKPDDDEVVPIRSSVLSLIFPRAPMPKPGTTHTTTTMNVNITSTAGPGNTISVNGREITLPSSGVRQQQLKAKDPNSPSTARMPPFPEPPRTTDVEGLEAPSASEHHQSLDRQIRSLHSYSSDSDTSDGYVNDEVNDNNFGELEVKESNLEKRVSLVGEYRNKLKRLSLSLSNNAAMQGQLQHEQEPGSRKGSLLSSIHSLSEGRVSLSPPITPPKQKTHSNNARTFHMIEDEELKLFEDDDKTYLTRSSARDSWTKPLESPLEPVATPSPLTGSIPTLVDTTSSLTATSSKIMATTADSKVDNRMKSNSIFNMANPLNSNAKGRGGGRGLWKSGRGSGRDSSSSALSLTPLSTLRQQQQQQQAGLQISSTSIANNGSTSTPAAPKSPKSPIPQNWGTLSDKWKFGASKEAKEENAVKEPEPEYKITENKEEEETISPIKRLIQSYNKAGAITIATKSPTSGLPSPRSSPSNNIDIYNNAHASSPPKSTPPSPKRSPSPVRTTHAAASSLATIATGTGVVKKSPENLNSYRSSPPSNNKNKNSSPTTPKGTSPPSTKEQSNSKNRSEKKSPGTQSPTANITTPPLTFPSVTRVKSPARHSPSPGSPLRTRAFEEERERERLRVQQIIDLETAMEEQRQIMDNRPGFGTGNGPMEIDIHIHESITINYHQENQEEKKNESQDYIDSEDINHSLNDDNDNDNYHDALADMLVNDEDLNSENYQDQDQTAAEDLDDLEFETNMLHQINAIVHETNEYFSSSQQDEDALEDHYNENIPSLANMNNPLFHQPQQHDSLVDEEEDDDGQLQGNKNLSYSTSSTMSSLSLESPASIAAKLHQEQKMQSTLLEGNDKPGTPNSRKKQRPKEQAAYLAHIERNKKGGGKTQDRWWMSPPLASATKATAQLAPGAGVGYLSPNGQTRTPSAARAQASSKPPSSSPFMSPGPSTTKASRPPMAAFPGTPAERQATSKSILHPTASTPTKPKLNSTTTKQPEKSTRTITTQKIPNQTPVKSAATSREDSPAPVSVKQKAAKINAIGALSKMKPDVDISSEPSFMSSAVNPFAVLVTASSSNTQIEGYESKITSSKTRANSPTSKGNVPHVPTLPLPVPPIVSPHPEQSPKITRAKSSPKVANGGGSQRRLSPKEMKRGVHGNADQPNNPFSYTFNLL